MFVLRSVAFLSLLLPVPAVRKQASAITPDLRPLRQVLRQARPYSAGALWARVFDEGASAYFDSIRKDLYKSTTRDLDDLRAGLGADYNDLELQMIKAFEKYGPHLEDLKFPRGPDFRRPGVSHIGAGPPSHFFDFDDVMELPPLPEEDPSARGESITRRLHIMEEDGKRCEWEDVTRCRDGKCTTEVIREGDSKASKGRGDVDAPPKRSVSFESISRVFRSESEDVPQQQQQQQQHQGLREEGETTQDPDDGVQSKAPGGEVVDPSKPDVYSESITRTIISRDVDGKREEVEIIERCQYGKCDRGVRRSDGVGSEKQTLEQVA
eukprot:CAMPEP_0170286712 /NCGR_PEP_ID=MMETSP0116_2-20130129/43408_1 /TAXON_ID=400756 /ORGANISM="Durinskia baltica, Strain CSIRO CS-38" /LENGTH=323 /DNA_ID=CAMNT_0010538119 /DNA_START=89 /DNA_END=1060 /DNA_ORIENTATION=-